MYDGEEGRKIFLFVLRTQPVTQGHQFSTFYLDDHRNKNLPFDVYIVECETVDGLSK